MHTTTPAAKLLLAPRPPLPSDSHSFGVLASFAVLCAVLSAQALQSAPVTNMGEFVMLEKLSDRVALAYWVGIDRRCNLTAIRGSKGLALVDTEMSPRIMAPIKERLEQEFGRSDWLYVINTHAHDNHAGGNSLFKKAKLVGHANLAEDMQWLVRRQSEPGWKNRELERADQYIASLQAKLAQVAARSATEARMIRGEMKFWELHTQDLREGYNVVKPSLTFSNTCTLDLGDLRLELIFFGKGHSLSDTLVYVPQGKLLVTGGIVYQRAQLPEIGEQSTMADVRRFLAVLDRFLSADVKIGRLVPSHSPPLVKQDMVPVRDYYQRMLNGVRLAQREGLTIEQTKSRLAATQFPAFRQPSPGSWCYGLHERNLKNLWRIAENETHAAQ